jgi:hypothetical protein
MAANDKITTREVRKSDSNRKRLKLNVTEKN